MSGSVLDNEGVCHSWNVYNNVLERHMASHLIKLISILTKGSLTPHGLARLMLLELHR